MPKKTQFHRKNNGDYPKSFSRFSWKEIKHLGIAVVETTLFDKIAAVAPSEWLKQSLDNPPFIKSGSVKGAPQCVAEIFCRQTFQRAKKQTTKAIFGSVTFGREWQFYKWEDDDKKVVFRDPRIYNLDELPLILGIPNQMWSQFERRIRFTKSRLWTKFHSGRERFVFGKEAYFRAIIVQQNHPESRFLKDDCRFGKNLFCNNGSHTNSKFRKK